MDIFCVIVDYIFGGVITSDVDYVGTDLIKAKHASDEGHKVWAANSPHVTIQVWRDGVHVQNMHQDFGKVAEWVSQPAS